MRTILLPVVILLVSMTTAEFMKRCRSLGDCSCSQQCVTMRRGSLKKCKRSDFRCICREGCGVFDEVVPAGPSAREIYGNSCRCLTYTNLSPTGRPAACTRATWWNAPEHIPEKEIHPGCFRQESAESREIFESQEDFTSRESAESEDRDHWF